MNEERVAHALGWFSIGLGVAELATGRDMADSLGTNLRTVRAFGLREVVTGVGILSQTRPAAWMWGRVAGDALDLTALGCGWNSRSADRGALLTALGAVAGVTVVDLWCAWRLSTNTYLKTRRDYPLGHRQPVRSFDIKRFAMKSS